MPKLILYTILETTILKNKNNELKKAQKILLVVTKQTPKPKRKPKKHPLKKPNNGDSKIKASIINNKKYSINYIFFQKNGKFFIQFSQFKKIKFLNVNVIKSVESSLTN